MLNIPTAGNQTKWGRIGRTTEGYKIKSNCRKLWTVIVLWMPCSNKYPDNSILNLQWFIRDITSETLEFIKWLGTSYDTLQHYSFSKTQNKCKHVLKLVLNMSLINFQLLIIAIIRRSCCQAVIICWKHSLCLFVMPARMIIYYAHSLFQQYLSC